MGLVRPELLLHPLIPPPLHGIAPRVILGQQWWDEQRKIAYAKHDHKCHACGIEGKATKKKYLEAHEAYDIDYENFVVTLKEVVALCPYCHKFIHVGRLLVQFREGYASRQYTTYILEHGIRVLSEAGLKPNAVQAHAYLCLSKNYSPEEATAYIIKKDLAQDKFNSAFWDQWRMIIDGETYPARTLSSWIAQYQ